MLGILGTVLPPEITFGDKSITGEDLQLAVRGAAIGVIVVLAGIIGLLIPAVRRVFESIAHATLPRRWGDAAVDQIEPADWGVFGKEGALDKAPFASPVGVFYMTDPISRASETMAQCVEAFALGAKKGATGTHG